MPYFMSGLVFEEGPRVEAFVAVLKIVAQISQASRGCWLAMMVLKALIAGVPKRTALLSLWRGPSCGGQEIPEDSMLSFIPMP
jgi:hypothetical protein